MPHPLLARAIDICKSKKLRFTPVRQQVFTLMAEHKGAISAYDLLAKLQDFDSNAKPPTIYRALDFLLENHFIHRIESLNSYLMCCHLGCEHPMQLLICDHCKQVIELSDPIIDETFSSKASQFGFKITNKILEAHGICKNCIGNTNHSK
ncbi:transcriptional repressor [Psychromonas sp. RZ22]|uniref:transcriptional repressor n=1 Tax=Psychromonas algarum TaxID=2555643 RepID=UPI001068735F|nr:transcriptional repressor [Psychromonas sp. RZ22]TEW53196.1 transcriptional repressor [Psychromonas sp. RZ22]